ncbi:MAG: ABC transporter ATP-binding protein [Gammaproteobacteria bacterium]
MDSSIVVAKGLSKRFGRRLAVEDVSFSLKPGEVFGLLGPNGSGKSTILRMLVGYLRPSSGSATVAGYDVISDGRAARAHLGYVPEDIPLYDAMRVDEFLTMMAGLKGMTDSVGVTLERVCAQLNLDDVRHVIIRKLSRGYRQRVSIAQALLGEPSLLILDEPTNGLDPRQIIECRNLILKLAGKHTVLMTSHILSEIEKVADRAAILCEGRLLGIEELNQGRGEAADLESRFLELMAAH